MKAVVYHTYGAPDVLKLREVDVPSVGDDQVLVRVRAASLNWRDWHCLLGEPLMARILAGGLLKPGHTILGVDVVGSKVRGLRPGDEVFGGCSKVGVGVMPC